ncbi:phosphonate C-P lyase system protein PhnH [Devosia sp.]|uniref:phosphonate C-P lyase system protein PhnH n=1 Tax=Devosia sp. TaxID=1871048 RepID=UPI0027336421|nr:phosphonate C-P lyase system protein PhnH [Devosia sp.]MDP2780144.1 phosphonate C-P lyase system protein PhnH [Devosia sp.]
MTKQPTHTCTPAGGTALQAWQPLTQQAVFRQLLHAFSYPGQIMALDCEDAMTHVLATLLDAEVSLADVHEQLDALAWQRLQARRQVVEQANFVLLDGSRPALCEPALGTLESPEGGATLILRVAQLGTGTPLALSGPGIASCTALSVSGLHSSWLQARQRWNVGFPLGVDLLLVDQQQLVALPRTTAVQFDVLGAD